MCFVDILLVKKLVHGRAQKKKKTVLVIIVKESEVEAAQRKNDEEKNYNMKNNPRNCLIKQK